MADILVIHDQAHLRQWLLDHARLSGHHVLCADDLSQARTNIKGPATFAVVVVGAIAGERPSIVVERVKASWPTAEVVVTARILDVADVAEAVRHGAYDCVKSSEPDRLVKVVLSAARNATLRRPASPHDADGVVHCDPATRAVFDKAARAASVNSTVLITGESGTGKEVLARRIYQMSTRSRFKFVPVNCGSLSETLIETELFGYRKGAFTGAAADSRGLIEEAEGGVLFLDEIGDMPLSMQIHLLRFLDSGEVRAVGCTHVKHVNTRVIAATNRPLADEIRAKRFREDLFFRLSVVSLELPPLRQRRGDIPGLLQFHLQRAARKLEVGMPTISADAMSLLTRYSWPGNIRQLQNVLEQAALQQSTGEITPADLPHTILEQPRIEGDVVTFPMHAKVSELVDTLRRHKGNRTSTAAELGISRSTLWRRLKRATPAPMLESAFK